MARTSVLRSWLVWGGAAAALSGAGTVAYASQRVVHQQAAAFSASVAPNCAPSALNNSAVLPGTSLSVSPLPGSLDSSPSTQISFLGAPAAELGHVSVSGSRSGSHSGRLLAYAQGDGASFVPSKPFAPGETVTVKGQVLASASAQSGGTGQSFSYQFTVSDPDPLPYARPSSPPAARAGELQSFHSRPDLHPQTISVTTASPQASPGYVLAAPYAGPGQYGPMIFDDAGQLVWFDPLPAGTGVTNLQVQQLYGRPVLTWWQGYIPPQGFGQGEDVIANSAYRVIAHVKAGNGYQADLHDFHITLQSTALITVFNPIHCNLSAVGGPANAAVTDSLFQEIDLRTGLVRREWHSLDHIGLSESYSSPRSATTVWPFDYVHINSLDPGPGGTLLISARNTWALYELNAATGQILTRIGGKHSNVKVEPGAGTAFQHDATVLSNGTIAVFDNGAVPKIHPQSRGIVLAVNAQADTDTLVAQYEHPTPLLAGSQGNLQPLTGGGVFVGWGSAPYFSEFSASGQLLFDAHLPAAGQSYRGYRFAWTGAPTVPPSIAASAANAKAPVTVYASWNGATLVASWRVVGGSSSSRMTAVASAPRSGFETAIATPGPEAYVAVQALSASGAVLGTSHTIRG